MDATKLVRRVLYALDTNCVERVVSSKPNRNSNVAETRRGTVCLDEGKEMEFGPRAMNVRKQVKRTEYRLRNIAIV